MTLVELARLVKEVRDTQRRYFRQRDKATLDQSRAIEKTLDKAVSDILDGPLLLS